MKNNSAIGGIIDRMQASSAGFVPFVAQNIEDVGGNKLAQGTVEVQPTDTNDVPIAAVAGGSGGALLSGAPAIFQVTNGTLPAGAQVADTTQTVPQNICYRITIKNATGTPVSILKLVQTQTFTNLNLDTYVASQTPLTQFVRGPQGTPGAQGLNGAPGIPGANGANGTTTNTSATGNWAVSGTTGLGLTTYQAPYIAPSGTHTGTSTLFDNVAAVVHVAGSGWNLGNSGGWSVFKALDVFMNQMVRGIKQGMNIVLNNKAVGDNAGLYIYNNTDGGATAESDEGNTALTAELIENSVGFVGTIASTTGLNDQHPVLTHTGYNSWLTDGAFLLNLTKGTITGNANGNGPGAGNFPSLNTTGVKIGGTAGSLPLTTAWGTFSNINDQRTSADAPRSITLNVTLSSIAGNARPFVAGHVVVAGIKYLEQSYISAVGTPSGGVQSITLTVRNANTSGGVLFQGGLAGQCLSWDANIVSPFYRRSSYPVLGSLTGTDLIYCFPLFGYTPGNATPINGSEPATLTGANSGFHLYPYAEVVANSGTGYTGITLEQNNVTWAVNDTVENPHHVAQTSNALRVVMDVSSPQSGNSAAAYIQTSGTGITGSTYCLRLNNLQSNYKFYANKFDSVRSGPMGAPTAIRVDGPFGNGIFFYYSPQPGVGAALITVGNLFGDLPASVYTDDIPIIDINTSGGVFSFNPAAQQYKLQNLNVTGALTAITVSSANTITAANFASAITQITASIYAVYKTQGTFLCNCTSGGVNVTLNANGPDYAVGTMFRFKKTDASANVVGIYTRSGTILIDGAASLILPTNTGPTSHVTLQYDGANWWSV